MQCHKRRGSLSVCIKDETEKMVLGSARGKRKTRSREGQDGERVCMCETSPFVTHIHTQVHTQALSE